MFHFNGAETSGNDTLRGKVTFRANIEPHPQFRLEDTNFVVTKKLHLGYALIGCTIDVTTFDGKTIRLPISDIVRPGHRIPLKGEGMPIIGFATKGDLLIEFDVIFPEKLSRNQKKLIKEALIKSNV